MRSFSVIVLAMVMAVSSAFAPAIRSTRWTPALRAGELDAEILGEIAKLQKEAEARLEEKKKELAKALEN